MELEQMITAMIAALSSMKLTGLQDYGRFPKTAQDLALMAKAYFDVLMRQGQETKILDFKFEPTPEIIQRAAIECAATCEEFPSATKFAKVAYDLWCDAFTFIGVEVQDQRTAMVAIPKSFEGDKKARAQDRVEAMGMTIARELPAPKAVSPEAHSMAKRVMGFDVDRTRLAEIEADMKRLN